MNNQQKNIFITGAASGIGKATAIYFANKGWAVGLFDINEKGLEEVAREIGHNACMMQKLDVTNKLEWEEAVDSFSRYTGGTCDLFFSNAGIANFTGRIEDIPLQESQKIIDVNFSGVVKGMYTMLPLLKNTEKSVVVSTSSIGGFVPVPGASVYSATKFAIRGLTEALRIEFKEYGIDVCEVNPWFTETPILDAKSTSDKMDGVLNREAILSRSRIARIHPVSKVAETIFAIYRHRKIHNKIGWEGKFVAFIMNYCPSIIRMMSRKMYKDYF